VKRTKASVVQRVHVRSVSLWEVRESGQSESREAVKIRTNQKFDALHESLPRGRVKRSLTLVIVRVHICKTCQSDQQKAAAI
jgi:hypothetical protein